MTASRTKTKVQPKAPPALRDKPPDPPSTFEWPVPQEAASEADALEIAGLIELEDQAFIPARRLIVLIPDGDLEEAEVARQVWDMAAPAGLAVLFFGLCKDTTEGLSMHRRLAILANLTRDPRVPVQTQLEFGGRWLRRLAALSGRGDVVVCLAEQRMGLRHRPVSEELTKRGLSVWTLEGIYLPARNPAVRSIREVIFWIVSIATIAGFFWLQVSITRLSEDWASSGLMYFSVLVEVGLLWIWHSVSQ